MWVTGESCACPTRGSGTSRKRGPSKVTADQVAGYSCEGRVSSCQGWGVRRLHREGTLENRWVVGVQDTWGRRTGRRADLGGDLRARARFHRVDSRLLKWETNNDILLVWGPSSFY